eukprot:1574204-Amphidinium_carterae.1
MDARDAMRGEQLFAEHVTSGTRDEEEASSSSEPADVYIAVDIFQINSLKNYSFKFTMLSKMFGMDLNAVGHMCGAVGFEPSLLRLPPVMWER